MSKVKSAKKEKEESVSPFEKMVEWLVGAILLIIFTLLFTAPIILLIQKIYPPAATSYVVYLILISVGYGLWRFIRWAN